MKSEALLLLKSFFFASSRRSVHFLCIMHFYHKYLVLQCRSKASNMKCKTIPKQKDPLSTFFDRLPFFRLCETFRKFFNVSKGSSFIFLIFCKRMDVLLKYGWFSALCDLLQTFLKKIENFSVFRFFERFSVEQDGFFAVSSLGNR